MPVAVKSRAGSFLLATVLAGLFPAMQTHAGSFYLPLHESPEIEARVERLFVLADMPIIKRPIPLSHIQKALDKVDNRDPGLVSSIRRYLERYESGAAITHFSVAAASGEDKAVALANDRGYPSDSTYRAALKSYIAFSDQVALNIGGTIGERAEGQRDEFPEGSFLSIGSDYVQADIGFRSHWWGPFQESDMLLSTQAAPMPNITFSNTRPLSLFGLNMSYEVFWARMSESDGIASEDDRNIRLTGYPRLFGTHISFNPWTGFAIGFNRILQYGGADRDGSLSGLLSAYVDAKNQDNVGREGNDFGNQLSSVTTRYTFGKGFPVALYLEYAGEDSSRTSPAALGNSALMYGIHLPQLTRFLDLSWEYAEWQNSWYINSNYADGLSNYGSTLGHWGAERRVLPDGDVAGAKAQTLKLIWALRAGTDLTVKYREIKNQEYSLAPVHEPSSEFQAELSQSYKAVITGLGLLKGTNVFGDNYAQFSAFLRW